MLVISRKTSEELIIGENIVVKVLEVVGDKVKIGIEAPRDIKIMRGEVSETIRSNLDSVSSDGLADAAELKRAVKDK